jgi:hypothetical protein
MNDASQLNPVERVNRYESILTKQITKQTLLI